MVKSSSMASNKSDGTSEQLSTCVLTTPSRIGLGSVSNSESLSQDYGNAGNLRRRLLTGPGWAASPTRQPRKPHLCAHHPHCACGTATSTSNQHGVNPPYIRRRSESVSSMCVPITPEDPPGWTWHHGQNVEWIVDRGCWRNSRTQTVPLPSQLHDCGPQELHFFRLVSGHGGCKIHWWTICWNCGSLEVFLPLQSFLQLGLEPDHRSLERPRREPSPIDGLSVCNMLDNLPPASLGAEELSEFGPCRVPPAETSSVFEVEDCDRSILATFEHASETALRRVHTN